MIVYRDQKPIEFSEYKSMMNYTANYIRKKNITDGRAEPFIKIIDSEFTNIGYQQNITDIGLLKLEVGI